MRTLHMTPGRATIEIQLLPSEQAQVTVTRWCENPIMVETVTTILNSIQNKSNVLVTPFDPKQLARKRRKGGRIPPSETETLRIVQGWQRVQTQMNQEVYASEQGISSATLRRWVRRLEMQGKL